MRRSDLRRLMVLIWVLFTVLVFAGWVTSARRIGCAIGGSPYPLDSRDQLIMELNWNQMKGACDVVSSSNDDPALIYSLRWRMLTCKMKGRWVWTELFVSENELKDAQSWIKTGGIPYRQGWLHFLSLAIETLGVVLVAGLVYFTVGVFRPVREAR